MKGKFRGVMAGVAATAALAVPSAAQAGTIHWADWYPLMGGQALHNPAYSLMTGAYCHEMDGDFVRQIQINAVWGGSSTLYGSWVQFTTSGLRSYASVNYLSGACRNPHTVEYSFRAHDNHIDV